MMPANSGLEKQHDGPAAQQREATILLVEDEATLAMAVRYTLQREHYRVLWADSGRTALALFASEPVDAVVLDLMLPGIDGREVCSTIRRTSTVPIIMVTALDSEEEKVGGLELGADDYLGKPFGMRELVARIRALLRRSTAPASDGNRVTAAGPLRILPERRQVYRDGRLVELRPREFDLLAFLARHPGQVFTRDMLLERVWGFDFEGESRTVDVHIRMLREKVELDPANPVLLCTVRNVGYCLRL